MQGKTVYRCWLYYTHRYVERKLVWRRYLELPFLPAPGMEIQLHSPEEMDGMGCLFAPFTMKRVIFLLADATFECHDEFATSKSGIDADASDCPCTEQESCCFRPGREDYKQMRRAGWELESDEESEEAVLRHIFRGDGEASS